MANDRLDQTIELHVIAPTPYFLVIFARVLSLSLLSMVGFVESCALALMVFGVVLRVGSAVALLALGLAIVLASTAFSLLVTAAIALGGSDDLAI